MRELHADDIHVTVVTTFHRVPERRYGCIGGFVQGGIIHKDIGVANIDAAGRRKPVIRAYRQPETVGIWSARGTEFQ